MLIGLVRDSVLQCFCHSCKAPLGIVGEWVPVARGPISLSTSIYPYLPLRRGSPAGSLKLKIGCQSACNTRIGDHIEDHFLLQFFMTLNNYFSMTWIACQSLKSRRNVDFTFSNYKIFRSLKERNIDIYPNLRQRFRHLWHWFVIELYQGGARQKQSLASRKSSAIF